MAPLLFCHIKLKRALILFIKHDAVLPWCNLLAPTPRPESTQGKKTVSFNNKAFLSANCKFTCHR